MSQDWQQLTKLTGNHPLLVERVRLEAEETAIEGSFELPPLARLSGDDQIFVIAFLRAHGSIKEMERVFGISYPTVKNRLNRIAEQFEFVQSDAQPQQSEVLALLNQGEISAAEAIERLSP
ncbi:MAG: RNA polymerase subunit sigma-70 [Dehalococcoidia bacterium]|nr:RNA polymerase subunit sigma-70 [Dehalococcoidia bacterium]|tara:strand:+ start:453 stop:815 length:363 start_codon:yes stop_codon:yes gene_type:complete